MKKQYLPVMTGLFAAFLTVLGSSLAVSASLRTSDTKMWPDIHEYSDTHFLIREEPETETEELPSLHADIKDHPYTEEELKALFHELPRYLESGSFVLNRLNHNPSGQISLNGTDVYINGKPFPSRMPWDFLQKTIASKLEEYDGDWSVYLKDLTTGATMEINEHSMESASLIKLYIAGTIFEKLENGSLKEDETMTNALYDMIVYSDNESSNVLVRYLYDSENGEDFQDGLAVVNDFIRRHDFTNTEQVNGISDPSLWVTDGRMNMTSAADCGRFLEMIYNHELVSHFASFRFEILLNKQQVNYKIPGGLPEGTHISHKTGEVEDTESDAAIIYTPYGDYIFCILSNHLTSTKDAVEHIHEITELVYNYFITPVFTAPEANDPNYALAEPARNESVVIEEIIDHATLIEVAE